MQDLGLVTAYAYAKSTGEIPDDMTPEQFAELLASYTTVAQEAAASAEAAESSATNAAASATQAGQSATNAAGSESVAASSASQAQTAAGAAAQSRTDAAASATAAAGSASQASSSASGAASSASAASTSASDADAAKTAAVAAQGAAETAQGKAEDAQSAAEIAQTAAEAAAASVTASAEQIETNRQDIADLKSDLNSIEDVTTKSISFKWEHGGIDNANGNTNNDGSLVRSRDVTYYPVSQLSSIQNNSNSKLWIIFYTYSDNVYTFQKSVGVNANDTYTFDTGHYVRFDIRGSLDEASLVSGIMYSQIVLNVDDLKKSVNNIQREFSYLNRFDPSTITSGYYLSTMNGTLTSNASMFVSDYIDVSDLTSITCIYTHIVCFYDSGKLFISGQSFNTRSADASIARPNNAVYMRFSTYSEDLNNAQIGEDVIRGNYVPYGKYTLPDLLIDKERIIVDVNGNGDYTSLTEALYENVDSGIDILVKAGTYDIVSEYVDLFGQSAVDSMADADTSTFNGFQYGVILRNRKITFASGSHLVCDWTGHTVDGTHRFSALRVDYNVEIVGLDLVGTALFYCIHDDYGLSNEPYTVVYRNCRVEGVNLTNANCIGGGCKKYSRHIIENCYFNNNLTTSATVRYHNTNADGAEPEIYVSNTYFNNWFTPRWYGAQTSKMKVYVNNCQASSIHKRAESSSYDVDNVELYKWCNTETNPVTS